MDQAADSGLPCATCFPPKAKPVDCRGKPERGHPQPCPKTPYRHRQEGAAAIIAVLPWRLFLCRAFLVSRLNVLIPLLLPARLTSFFRMTAWRAAALAALSLLAGCSTVNPYYDASKKHHRPGGFQNNYSEFEPKGLGELLRWQWQAARQGLPAPPKTPTATVTPDISFIGSNARAGAAMQPAITWIGHATMLAQFSGLNLITDPVFSERASPLSFIGPQRAQPPGLSLAQLPRIDVVLVSHNHYDHLDEASVKALNAQAGGAPLFVVPLGIKPWLAQRGISNVVELDWWQTHTVKSPRGEVELVFTPAQHWSGRSLSDRLATLWGGFAVFAPDLHFIYTGDTGYSRDFADIAARYASRQTASQGGGFDIALVPIGAYEPRWFMATQHVNPDEAVRIHRDLGAKLSVGVHWGTFNLTDEALDEPPQALAAARRAQGVDDQAFVALAIGETRRLPPRRPQP
jgi:N-acyl-phosphatidylethanolamine-hydrolysing phospholipase D